MTSSASGAASVRPRQSAAASARRRAEFIAGGLRTDFEHGRMRILFAADYQASGVRDCGVNHPAFCSSFRIHHCF
jgi:hypothetical protein